MKKILAGVLAVTLTGTNVGFPGLENKAYAADTVLAGGAGIKNAVDMKLNTTYVKEWKYDIKENINNVDENTESWYTFETSSDGLVTIDVTRPYDEINDVYVQVDYYIYNSSYKKVWSNDHSEYRDSGAKQYTFHVGLPEGKYYLYTKAAFETDKTNVNKMIDMSNNFKVSLDTKTKCELEPNAEVPSKSEITSESLEAATTLKKKVKYAAYINYQGSGGSNNDANYTESDCFKYCDGRAGWNIAYVKIYNFKALTDAGYQIWVGTGSGSETEKLSKYKLYKDGSAIFEMNVFESDEAAFIVNGSGNTSEIEYAVEVVDGYEGVSSNSETNLSPTNNSSSNSKVGKTFVSGNLKYKIKSINTKKKTGTCQIIGTKNSSVKTVTIKSAVKKNGIKYTVSLAKNCFVSNKKITKVTIGAGIKSIPTGVFKNCKSLKSVVIGKNVKTIGKEAFYGCAKLTKITYKYKALTSVGKNALKGINKKAKLYIYYKKIAKKFNGKGQKKTVKIISKK